MRSKDIVARLFAWWKPLLLATVLAVGIGAGSIRAEIQIGPHLSAAEIRTARKATFATELQLIATIETRVLKGEKGPSEEPTLERMRIGLGPKYVYVASAKALAMYDYVLRRIFSIDVEAQTFVSRSLYTDVAFRDLESRNRRAMAKQAAGAGLKLPTALADRFWRETSLGVVEDRGSEPLVQFVPATNDYTLAMHDGEKVAWFRFSDHRLSREELPLFLRVLRIKFKLHPDIIERIGSAGRIPSEIVYREYTQTNHLIETRVTFERPETVNAEYPLSADLTVDLKAAYDDAFAIHALPIALAAVSSQHGSGPPSVDDFTTRMDRSLDRGSVINAALVWFEFSLFMPNVVDCKNKKLNDKYCITVLKVSSAIQKDRTALSVFRALVPEKSGMSLSEGIKTLSSISREGLDAGNILDLFEANLLSSAGQRITKPETKRKLDRRSLDRFLSALNASPYLASIYKDIGDFYFQRFDTFRAWLYWDLGRALPVRSKHTLNGIDKFEAELRRSHPEYF